MPFSFFTFTAASLLLPLAAQAQSGSTEKQTLPEAGATICVTDSAGLALPQVEVRPLPAGPSGVTGLVAVTGEDGCVRLPSSFAAGSLRFSRAGFASTTVQGPTAGQVLRLTLGSAVVQQTVAVTGDRGLAGVDDEANSVVALGAAQLAAPPALALDDRLHQVAGFQLYRRTSSWTANPTTEGVSLRGLGSTAASRTLVVSDQVPLNDPFGGWIHWDEIPALAIRDVELERGGAADLYGSSAIGGVIEIDPVTPSVAQPIRLDVDALGATENSASADLLVAGVTHTLGWLLAGSGVDTGGYIPTAPTARGRVDIPADVAEESGRAEVRSANFAGGDSLFLRGNVLNESRGNGTPDQTNGTRLWR